MNLVEKKMQIADIHLTAIKEIELLKIINNIE